MDRLSRRQFVASTGAASLGLLVGCGRLPWQAQPAPRVYRMGYLTPVNETVDAPRFGAVRGALRDLGWIEGQNLLIERRLAEGQAERLPTLAAELAQLQPDVVLTLGEPGARAMQQATDTIPI